MTALSETQARIASVGKLGAVVGAMRGMAATHTQQARAALTGYRAYARIIAEGLARAAELGATAGRPSAPSRRAGGGAVVVFAAEHGLAGGYSDRVLDAHTPDEGTLLFVVGGRGLTQAQARGWPVDWSAPMASQVSGVPAAARRVADALYAGFAAGRFARADAVYCELSGALRSSVVRRPILPIPMPAAGAGRRGPPLTNLPPERLFERLIDEHVFAELALAALESFASENAARLATMESARLNIAEKLTELTGLERLLRQDQITAEVQEVTAGALAAH